MHHAPFTASFTPDSPCKFTVFPNEGVLEPPGRGDGTVFIVSFTPTEYGKTQVGKLVIQTEEMQWSYEQFEAFLLSTRRQRVQPSWHHGQVADAQPGQGQQRGCLKRNMDVKESGEDSRQRRQIPQGWSKVNK